MFPRGESVKESVSACFIGLSGHDEMSSYAHRQPRIAAIAGSGIDSFTARERGHETIGIGPAWDSIGVIDAQ